MMTVKEAVGLWGISERRVTLLCREGRVDGAKRDGRIWLIPEDAKKPADHRIRSGVYCKSVYKAGLPLPIGVSDYRLAVTEYYYVDKTMMIKEFLDERPMVSLFTRPRRFGKTLNMDMLRVFFEKTQEDTSVYFKNKKIWACGPKYRAYQGKYPVIFITLKDAKKETWDETFAYIVQIVTAEYKRHSELSDSSKVQDLDYYQSIVQGTFDKRLFDSSLQMLTKMLYEHYGEKAIVIVDEYDTPIQQGHDGGFYDDVIRFMRNLFSGCFKDNRFLAYGFLTGILRVAKESIFSGLNNLTINSVLDSKYSEYFGFTEAETKQMARYYRAEEKFDEICEWYDGYRFGSAEIFNPWSVINYFRNECRPGAYWQSTGSNEIIGDILQDADRTIYQKLQDLIQGKTVTTHIDTSVVYPQVKKNPSSVFSFLMVAGYLKAINMRIAVDGDFLCEVALPNKEISYVYRKEILNKLSYMIPRPAGNGIQEAIFSGDAEELKRQLQELLLQSVSYFDTVGENFYHGFMLGLCALLEQYQMSSNRESGYGRYDIQLKPNVPELPGILMELKSGKGCTDEELKLLAETAKEQIERNQYEAELRLAGVTEVLKYGVAFDGKRVEISVG